MTSFRSSVLVLVRGSSESICFPQVRPAGGSDRSCRAGRDPDEPYGRGAGRTGPAPVAAAPLPPVADDAAASDQADPVTDAELQQKLANLPQPPVPPLPP